MWLSADHNIVLIYIFFLFSIFILIKLKVTDLLESEGDTVDADGPADTVIRPWLGAQSS